jgi:hypothetical protein
MIKISKYCLIAICLFMSSQAFSQNFISEKKLWSVVYIGSSGDPWVKTSCFRFSGDTILNQRHYFKLYGSEDENGEKWILRGLWFEENNFIYSYWIPTKQTTLVYDFNIVEGDSFQINEYSWIFVDSIRTLEWGGKLRKHWFFSSHKDAYFDSDKYTVWIEGVGQTGLLTRSSENGITGAFNHLLCFSENGEQVYQNPDYSSCWINTTSAPSVESQKDMIELFQLDDGNIQLKLSKETSGELFLYTIDGKQVLKMSVKEPDSRFCAPTTGILFYRFISKKDEVNSGRIVLK